MKSYKTYGIILKRINLGEADRIVTAYTYELGKIKFIAKGVRKIKSRLAGSIEPFYFSDLVLSQGKNLDILTSASIRKIAIKDEKNLALIKLASFLAELIDKMLPENSPNVKLFDLLEEILDYINEEKRLDLLRFYFESKFYQLSGVFPETFVCVKCGRKLEGEVFFSAQAGGVTDESCRLSYNDSRKINMKAVKVWRFTSEHSFLELKKLKIPDSIKEEIVEISNGYLSYVTQRDFNSDKIEI
jgi:DNA repair protein RecO (recombination protein O)